MQLVLNTFGAYLSKSGDCFEVKVDDQKQVVSAKKVQSILITTGCAFSSDAIELAMNHNIDVVFLDKFGQPFGRVWQSKLGSTTRIRRRQLEISETDEGLKLVTEWVTTKLNNQIDFLEELQRHRPPKAEKLNDYLATLKQTRDKIAHLSGTLEEKRGSLMGLEGGAGHAYFAALAYLVPEPFKFEGRSRQPARDEFNAMLNYSYGILYSMVERACILAGLDPYLGFLHTDNYNKKSLVFDLIEPFRILGEKTTFYLFSKRQVKKEYFDPIPNGMTLNAEGKKVLISAFNERLDSRVRYRGRNIIQRDVIQFECHRLANHLIGSDKAREE
ncbi:MAG: CRISPR-associated endonuclease Cas1 [candidate division KSB1 bacterium]|nr:CRISPR-associated endonuclease Cas1 [candidate division KSB1 bacterium]